MTEQLARLRAALANRYKIEREIGSGGMATVYSADDQKHHRKVAVKVLRPELAAALGADRFLREIEIAARLSHPHILPLYDSGHAKGFLYYVMPLIEGESLRARLARAGELPIGEAVRILREVVDALSYAHAQGVVHRDIKPDNVLISGRHALVTDFGVAKAVSEATGRQTLTTAGVALGTPAYMAPEQAAAEPHLDHRVDIYAVGALAYELLAGRTVFEAPTAQAMLAAHATKKPEPITKHRETIPPGLAELVMRCLAKRPADRWQSGEEMLPQLEALATTPTGGVTPTDTRPLVALAQRKRAWVIAAGIAAVLVLAVAGGVLLWNRGRPVIKLGRTTQITNAPGVEIDPAMSPDGRFIAYAAGPASQMHLYVRQLTGSQAIDLTKDVAGNHRSPQWSPDGTQILFATFGRSGTTLNVVPALGGALRELVAAPTASGRVDSPAWSPDGRRIAYVRVPPSGVQSGIQVQDVEGTTEPRRVVEGFEIHSLAWSPDGSRIAYVSGNRVWVYGSQTLGNAAPSAVWVVSVSSGDAIRVAGGRGSRNLSPVWTPDGRTLLFVSNKDGARDVYAVRVGRAGKPSGSAERLTTGLNAHGISLSGDGRTLAYSAFTIIANIWAIAIPATGVASASQARQVTTGNGAVEGIAVSPDRRRLAFDLNRGGNADIYTMQLPDGEPVQLTSDLADDFIPSWSPDGREIAFYSTRFGTRNLFVMSLDGGNLVRVTSDSAEDRYPDWAPDGHRLVFMSDRSGRQELYVIERAPQGKSWGKTRQLTTSGGSFPRWSPDGRWVAYVGGDTLRLVSPEGGEPRALVASDDPDRIPAPAFVAWLPDSRTLYYKASDRAGRSSFWAVPVAGGVPRLLVRFDDAAKSSNRPEFTTDGKQFFFTIGRHESDIYTVEVLK